MSNDFHDIKNLNEFSNKVKELIEEIPPRLLICLNGPMGVGKTKFVEFLILHLGGGYVSSPSFAIHNIYATPKYSVDHLDLFRLENEDDLESTGFWDLFAREMGLIVVEWADRLDVSYFPPNWPRWNISLEFADSGGRFMKIEKIT